MHRHTKHSKKNLNELTQQLKDASQKITGPRQAILRVLREHPRPMTNKEIHGHLPDGMCDLATVYRAIHMLINMGMAERYDFGDGVARFELSDSDHDGHHHHLVCTKCTTIVELDECFGDELEQAIAKKHSFSDTTHKLEFFGVCPSCRKKKKPRSK
jgi:Fur family ferric uptake transcriptional regulator